MDGYIITKAVHWKEIGGPLAGKAALPIYGWKLKEERYEQYV